MPVSLAASLWPRIEDLCEPAALSDLRITADRPAYRDRRLTRQIASTFPRPAAREPALVVHLPDEWHTIILFRDQILVDAVTDGAPLQLDVASPPGVEAARPLDTG